MAEQAAGELQAGGMVTADGRVSPWFTIHQQATKSLTGLALRLRLGPQSRDEDGGGHHQPLRTDDFGGDA